MRELTLGGIHDDSDHLILLDSEGERYTVRIDEALRAAVRRDKPSVALLQQGHETSSLRPKEIQALLRGGASVESIAQMSDISEERIRRFEGPILAERAHVAQRALSFRPGRGSEHTLAEVVNERLAARNVEKDPEWDAWRRADGTWTLQLLFVAGSRTRTATWHLDVPARVAKAEDDEARWLSDAHDSDAELQRPRLASVRSKVFNVEEPATPLTNDSSAAKGATNAGTSISEAQIDELNARRGIPSGNLSAPRTFTPWQSLEDAAAAPAQEESDSGVYALTHVHHDSVASQNQGGGPTARNDFQRTEEVEYVDAPHDLSDSADATETSDSNDPAHDPGASEPELLADSQLHDDGQDDDAETAHASEDWEEEASGNAETLDPRLTPLPGFDAEDPKPAKKSKKGRASIPSWDDIVFGSRDR